jgi:hypothetical protein
MTNPAMERGSVFASQHCLNQDWGILAFSRVFDRSADRDTFKNRDLVGSRVVESPHGKITVSEYLSTFELLGRAVDRTFFENQIVEILESKSGLDRQSRAERTDLQ